VNHQNKEINENIYTTIYMSV